MRFDRYSLVSHCCNYELNPGAIRVGICGGQSGTGSGFIRAIHSYPVSCNSSVICHPDDGQWTH